MNTDSGHDLPMREASATVLDGEASWAPLTISSSSGSGSSSKSGNDSNNSSPSPQNTSRVLIQRDDDDWTGLADANARRRIQNRLNQRALRQRRAAQARAIAAATDDDHHHHHEAASQQGDRRLVSRARSITKIGEYKRYKREDGGDGSKSVRTVYRTIPGTLDYLQTFNPILSQYHARRILHFLRCVAFPNFDLHMPQATSLNPVDVAIYQMVLSDSLLLNTQILRLASAQLFREYDQALWKLTMDLEADVFPRLRQALSTSSGEVSDGVIWAVHILSITRTPPCPRERLGLFDRPVATLGYARTAGPYVFDPKHHSIFPHLMRQRGGIRAVRSPALAEVFQFVDVLSASHNYTVPALEFTDTSLFLLDGLASRRPPLDRVSCFGVDLGFQEILLDILICCQELEGYSIATTHFHSRRTEEGSPSRTPRHMDSNAPRPPKLLLQYRNIIQHRLLQIPPCQPETEICRLATLLFVYGVIWSCAAFPDPQHWDPMRKLSEDLRVALSDPQYTAGAQPEFLWWAAMIGGLASSSLCLNAVAEDHGVCRGRAGTDALSSFFTQELRDLNCHEDLQILSWPEAKSLLRRYLWMDYACDRGGQILWRRLVQGSETAV